MNSVILVLLGSRNVTRGFGERVKGAQQQGALQGAVFPCKATGCPGSLQPHPRQEQEAAGTFTPNSQGINPRAQ